MVVLVGVVLTDVSSNTCRCIAWLAERGSRCRSVSQASAVLGVCELRIPDGMYCRRTRLVTLHLADNTRRPAGFVSQTTGTCSKTHLATSLPVRSAGEYQLVN